MAVCLIAQWLFSSQAPEGASESVVLAQLQSELVGVQSSLFSLGLELEASQRRLRQSQRQGDDLMRLKDRLISDLQEVLQHREVTEKHNQVCALGSGNEPGGRNGNKPHAESVFCPAGPPLCPSEKSLRTPG